MFKYVSLLRSQPPSSATFSEIKALADLRFTFAEKSRAGSYATAISNSMQIPVPRDRIMANGLLEKFNAEELALSLQLLDPRRATMGVTCKELPKGVEGTWNENEPIYGTEMFRMKMSEEFLKEVSFLLRYESKKRVLITHRR
jgi:insulysin